MHSWLEDGRSPYDMFNLEWTLLVLIRPGQIVAWRGLDAIRATEVLARASANG